MQVLKVVKNDILNRIFKKNCTDLVSHLYCSVLDIKELYSFLKNVLKKSRIVNLDNNKVDKKQL